MPQVTTVSERLINAPIAVVAACIRDYQRHHPRFLPPAFSDFRVEAGGIGAGTVIRYTFTVANQARSYRDVVTEPEPGRVIVETDAAAGKVTTFHLRPVEGQTQVRITTIFPPSAGGPAGWIERWLAPRLLRPIYREELARLDAYASQQAGARTHAAA